MTKEEIADKCLKDLMVNMMFRDFDRYDEQGAIEIISNAMEEYANKKPPPPSQSVEEFLKENLGNVSFEMLRTMPVFTKAKEWVYVKDLMEQYANQKQVSNKVRDKSEECCNKVSDEEIEEILLNFLVFEHTEEPKAITFGGLVKEFMRDKLTK